MCEYLPPMTDGPFTGRVAAITGAASGIGLACAGHLAGLGASVGLIDRDGPAAAAAAAAIGGRAMAATADVSVSAEVDLAVAATEAALGPPDVLVCSAGIGGDSLHTVEVTDAEWRRVFAVNCDGVFYANRAVLGGMVERGYGRIVNIASIAGKEGNPMAAAYSASKAAVIGMTKAIGKDVAGTGVLVNCIAPAVIRTPILDQLSQAHIDYMLERIPLGRMGEVGEVARLVAFLAGEDLSFSTGATYDISGGRATY
jgi:NAD(P)-dependent dehydrogenase (short-subunit alcohol dehydrogenase family)